MSRCNYRYASTMGERYAMPIYFPSLHETVEHERMCLRLLHGLPGQDSMRIEAWDGNRWTPVRPQNAKEAPLPTPGNEGR